VTGLLVVGVLVGLPSVVAILFGALSLVRWNKAMKARSKGDRLITGILGPFALLSPRSGDAEERKHLSRFYLSMISFIAYNTFIALLLGAINR
jgi:hypothetical protein